VGPVPEHHPAGAGNHEYITGSICQQPNGTMRLMTVQEAAGAG
jgi:hypothetical protein